MQSNFPCAELLLRCGTVGRESYVLVNKKKKKGHGELRAVSGVWKLRRTEVATA